MSSQSGVSRRWLDEREGEHLECKEAKGQFHFHKLLRYCAAIANEGGGRIILGVTNKPPRKVVGTKAFPELERTVAGLTDRLRLKITCQEIHDPEGRVLIFEVPSRPAGIPIEVDGAYNMRAGDDLRPMTPDRLREILNEVGPDFSAEICPQARLADLDSQAIERFRFLWRRKSGNAALEAMPVEQLLRDAELILDHGLTYAALILLGTREGLTRHLAQAEIVFEYRATEESVSYQQREEFRQGFLCVLDEVWELINRRNEVVSFQQGLFRWEIPVFDEAVVREAILNAVTHRDYRLAGSILVRQYPRKLEVISPGGFPTGVSPDNILWTQSPRNRRISESCQRCGLVERSGQGADRMFEQCIRQGKPRPDYSHSGDSQVWLTLRGEVEQLDFLRFLEKVAEERALSFTVEDLVLLDLLHREEPVWEQLKPRLAGLVEAGIIERIGRGRGTRYILSRKLYSFLGRAGDYTRRRGLDRETNKELLLRHIRDQGSKGVRLKELQEVLPGLSRYQVQSLLRELKRERRIHVIGSRRAGRWFPGSGPKPSRERT